VGEQLALAGLVDEMIVSTSQRRLEQPGIIAIRPALAAMLADKAHYQLSGVEKIGQDMFETYQRVP
jgi:diaminohydroxyphosphoribosylaminopyrimidine deaminase / 5-amino-6-(5-phosphoribosylamino)uracil reductase